MPTLRFAASSQRLIAANVFSGTSCMLWLLEPWGACEAESDPSSAAWHRPCLSQLAGRENNLPFIGTGVGSMNFRRPRPTSCLAQLPQVLHWRNTCLSQRAVGHLYLRRAVKLRQCEVSTGRLIQVLDPWSHPGVAERKLYRKSSSPDGAKHRRG